MEGSADVDGTLLVYHRLLDTFGRGVRLALQTYLYRTPDDLRRIIQRGGGVRLVKGAYNEPPHLAYQGKREIRQISKVLMTECITFQARQKRVYLALGSHDPALIEWLIDQTAAVGLSKNRFEFQMLLGVRRKEQQRLADQGYQMRVYVPYGKAWYPYFMRRLAERPANVFFILRAMIGS
jgi:proline dehydrogenase